MADFKHIKLSEERERALVAWMDEKIDDIEERQEARMQSWKLYREMYEGKTWPKNFPWKNASNIHVPITAIMVDAIHANMMNRLYGFDRLWDVLAEHPSEQVGVDTVTNQPVRWADVAKAVQGYLKWESGDSGPAQVYDGVEGGLLECIKMGTAVWYTPWLTTTRPDFAYDQETMTLQKDRPKVLYDGPRVDPVPLEDFLILPFYSEIHGPNASPLVGHKELWRPGQVYQAVADGKFRKDVAQRILAGGTLGQWDAGDSIKDHQAVLEGEYEGISDIRGDDVRIYRLWLEVDVDNDGIEESVYVEYHKDTGTICRITPYLYPTRPYVAARYVRRENRFYGIGVPEMLLSLQHGVNTSVNQAVDNATIANVRAFAVRRNSVAARSLDDYYPGKKILFDQDSDIKDFQLGEVYPSAFEVGRILQVFAEKRVGIGDPDLGREVPGNFQGTASTTFALLQQAAQRFDLYARDIRRALSEIGMQVLERVQQFKPVDRMYMVMGEKGELVEKSLTLPMEFTLRQHLRVTTTSSTSASNKEVVRQNAMAAFQVITQYFERVMQLAQVIVQPQIPEPLRRVAYQMTEVGEKLMGRILEGFDMEDVSADLPQLEGLLNAGATDPGLGGAPAPLDQATGMEGPGEAVGAAPGAIPPEVY